MRLSATVACFVLILTTMPTADAENREPDDLNLGIADVIKAVRAELVAAQEDREAKGQDFLFVTKEFELELSFTVTKKGGGSVGLDLKVIEVGTSGEINSSDVQKITLKFETGLDAQKLREAAAREGKEDPERTECIVFPPEITRGPDLSDYFPQGGLQVPGGGTLSKPLIKPHEEWSAPIVLPNEPLLGAVPDGGLLRQAPQYSPAPNWSFLEQLDPNTQEKIWADAMSNLREHPDYANAFKQYSTPVYDWSQPGIVAGQGSGAVKQGPNSP